MKIRMTVTAAGPRWAANEGEVIDLDEREAAQLVAGKFAELVPQSTKVDRRVFQKEVADDSAAAWTARV